MNPAMKSVLSSGRAALLKLHAPGRQRQAEDDDDIRDALDEDRAHAAADRSPVVALQQPRPVQVPQLGGDEAVHEPRQEQDLGGVAERDRMAGPRQDEGPAIAAQREGQVVDREGTHQQQGVGVDDPLPGIGKIQVEDEAEEEVDQDDAEDNGADRPPVEHPVPQRNLTRRDPLVRRRIKVLAGLVGRAAVPVGAGRVLRVLAVRVPIPGHCRPPRRPDRAAPRAMGARPAPSRPLRASRGRGPARRPSPSRASDARCCSTPPSAW